MVTRVGYKSKTGEILKNKSIFQFDIDYTNHKPKKLHAKHLYPSINIEGMVNLYITGTKKYNIGSGENNSKTGKSIRNEGNDRPSSVSLESLVHLAVILL